MNRLVAVVFSVAKAKPDVKSRIEQRIADVRKDFAEREQKLTRAYKLTQEALGG